MPRTDHRPSVTGPQQMAGAAVTVSAMGAQDGGRADHAPYITAVRRYLETRDVRVADVRITGQASRRAAKMLLHPDEDAFAEQVPVEVSVTWDEENGWALAGHKVSARLAPGVRWHMGLSVLPEPEEVAAWVAVLLAHPEATPSREDHPFRDQLVDDPEFEAQLMGFTGSVSRRTPAL